MSVLDRTFRISLVLKGLDGILELIGGVLLLLVSPDQINSVVRFLTQHELAEDPNDFVANHPLDATSDLASAAFSVATVGCLMLPEIVIIGA